MKDKDFGFAVVFLIAIFFGKEIKEFAAKKLGHDEPHAVIPETFLPPRPDPDWLKPGIGGLINQDRQPGSQAAWLLDQPPAAEPTPGGLSFPLFPQKPSLFDQLMSESATGQLDSAEASGQALPKSEQPDGGM